MYTEPVKIKSRELVITNAVRILTSNRKTSTLTRRSYVREIKEHIINEQNVFDIEKANLLSDETINRWECFYDSIIQTKKPASLKVAYLSGPNPENDLEVFCSSGLLPENIWAFESDKDTFSEAKKSALMSKFQFIKIVNVSIESFLDSSPQRFDIIYLDFCGPLPSRNKDQKTLLSITKILAYHALNSPGILITNVSLPTQEKDPEGRNSLSKLVAHYLYPKDFLEKRQSGDNFIEGPIAYGLTFDQFMKNVSDDMGFFYGQFVTRLLIDHASYISPHDRIYQKPVFSKFFNLKVHGLPEYVKNMFRLANDYCSGGDIIMDPGQNPTLWTLAALDRETNARDKNYPQHVFDDENFNELSSLFVSQLTPDANGKKLLEKLSTLSFLFSQKDGFDEFLSKSLRGLHRQHKISNYYQFCDLVLFHQILELLFRQIAVPYHVNIEKTRRWTYQARETPMFMDMIVLDECRYLYDWMPTADLLSPALFDIQQQLSYRFALDGVGKHGRWYNPEYFSGTAIIDQFTKGFEAKILKRRKILT